MENAAPGPFPEGPDESRREFIKQSTLLTAMALTPPLILGAEAGWHEKSSPAGETVPLQVEINGTRHALSIDPRVTLLDLLRNGLDLTGTK